MLSPLEKGVTANTDHFHPGHVGHFELGVSSLFPIQLLASLVVEVVESSLWINAFFWVEKLHGLLDVVQEELGRPSVLS